MNCEQRSVYSRLGERLRRLLLDALRNLKRLILNGYSVHEIRAFRIPLAVQGALISKRSVELVVEFRAQLILRYCISARNSDPGLTPVTKSQSRARVQAT